MLSDKELKEEARKRLQSLDPEVRAKYEREINEMFDFADTINGALTKEQNKKLNYFALRDANLSTPGPAYDGAIEKGLMRQLNVSREELITMKKNPFRKGMLATLILAVLAGLGIVVTYAIAKATGADASLEYSVLGIMSGSFSLAFGNQLVHSVKFRNMQKRHYDPEFQEKEIQAAMYNELKEEIERERNK